MLRHRKADIVEPLVVKRPLDPFSTSKAWRTTHCMDTTATGFVSRRRCRSRCSCCYRHHPRVVVVVVWLASPSLPRPSSCIFVFDNISFSLPGTTISAVCLQLNKPDVAIYSYFKSHVPTPRETVAENAASMCYCDSFSSVRAKRLSSRNCISTEAHAIAGHSFISIHSMRRGSSLCRVESSLKKLLLSAHTHTSNSTRRRR